MEQIFPYLYNINTLFETDLLKRGQPVAEKFLGGYWKKNHTKIQGCSLFLCHQNQIQVMREYYVSKLQKIISYRNPYKMEILKIGRKFLFWN